MIEIGAKRLTVADVHAVAREGAPAGLAPAAAARIGVAHQVLLELMREGAPIYGVSTGLGAAVDTNIRAEGEERQRRIPLARAVGVGRRAAPDEVRAMIVARVSRMACGCSGVSLATAEALLALVQVEVTPVVAMTGSVGEADLAPLAQIGAVLAGEGEAEFEGAVLPAAEALARAGVGRPVFAAKDGLALVSSNAASVGIGALVVRDAGVALQAALAAVALSIEGFRGSVAPFDARASALRGAPGQEAAAARIRALLRGGDLSARRLQDPLSFRVAASVHGAAEEALEAARAAVELELNTSDDNPAILVEDRIALPNANFDPTWFVLAFEQLGQAMLRIAAASAGRVMRLMSPGVSALPRFLVAASDGRNGFATVQKTVAALVAQMQHRAAPMPAVLIPVADSIEDYGTMATGIVEKTAELVAELCLVTAIELMVAAQACDLRGKVRLGEGTRAVHAAVRAVAPVLEQDRRTGPDIEALAALVRDGAFG